MKIDFFSNISKGHYYSLRYPEADRFIVKVLWVHFILLALFALLVYYFQPGIMYPNPLSWGVVSFEATVWVITIGFLASLLPTILRGKFENHYFYRILVTNCLFVFSYLFVFDTGGSIEAHFHFFIVLALLAIYNDWRLGWIGVLLVVAHHGILNIFSPHWVYYFGRNDFAVFSHALPVIIAALYLTWITDNGLRAVQTQDKNNKELEIKLRQNIPELNT